MAERRRMAVRRRGQVKRMNGQRRPWNMRRLELASVPRGFSHAMGFTLIELLVVIAIIAILAACFCRR